MQQGKKVSGVFPSSWKKSFEVVLLYLRRIKIVKSVILIFCVKSVNQKPNKLKYLKQIQMNSKENLQANLVTCYRIILNE